jgi:glycosyltransferase involved in cell wall biosynthesis
MLRGLKLISPEIPSTTKSKDATKHMRVSVVIPCCNEEESIEEVIRSVPQEVHEILVVDNNSTDRTVEIAIRNGARVVEERKQGYGAALKCGFRNAAGEIIATLDGDNQYPACKIMEIAELLVANNLDFISASRFPLDHWRSMPLLRIIGNFGLTLATNILFNLRLGDAQSGMWLFRKEVLGKVHLESDGMALTEEIKVRVAIHPEIRSAEHHIPYHPRLGKSKLNPFADGCRMFIFLCKLRIRAGTFAIPHPN